MRPEQIDALQASFARVVPISDTAAALFYARLFEIAPHLRPLFGSSFDEQGRKLMAALGTVVSGLRDLDRILPAVEALAVRHVGYGVRPDDYGPVGEALIDTLRQGLGADFTADLAGDWADAYATLSGVMIAAAYPDRIARAGE